MRRHLAATACVVLLAIAIMGRWVVDDRMPPGDFAGYAASIREVHDDLLRYGRVPTWRPWYYGGTTSFVSRLKEHLAFPLAVAMGPVVATKLMFVLTKIAAALAMYSLFVRVFRDPAAGLLAGCAYAFGTGLMTNLEHLEVHCCAVLFPLFLWAVADVRDRGTPSSGAVLGAIAAWTLSLSQVQFLVLAILGTLAVTLNLRPSPSRDARDDKGVGAIVAAVVVFIAFAASQVCWFALDGLHHALLGRGAPEDAPVLYWVERSPLFYVARGGHLPDALRRCIPHPTPLTLDDPTAAGRHYLGLVGIVVFFAGWWHARRYPDIRRWLKCGVALLLAQLWLSTGSNTHLEEVASGCGWPPDIHALVRYYATMVGASALVIVALRVLWRARRRERPIVTRTSEALLASSIVCFGTVYSLFDLARAVFPFLRELRSPGHFVDLAPFSMALLVGVAVVALTRERRQFRSVTVAVVAILLAADHWPTAVALDRGTPMSEIRPLEARMRSLRGEGGTRRVLVGGYLGSVGDYVTSASEAGTAFGWLVWQANRDWRPFVWAILLGSYSPDAEERRAGEALSAAGRVSYMLMGGPPGLGSWEVLDRYAGATIWALADIAPMPLLYRGVAVHLIDETADAGEMPRILEARLAGRLLLKNRALVSITPEAPGAAEIARRADAVVKPGATADLAAFSSLQTMAPPPIPVTYRRPATDRIELDAEGSSGPGLVVVSESYHPWWRATVDGEDALLVRSVAALIGVPVGAGRHTIVLRFRPPLLIQIADAVLAAAWVGLLLVAVARVARLWDRHLHPR